MISYDYVKQWKQSGKVYFWEYKAGNRTIVGYHLSWGDEGKQSIMSLLNFLNQQFDGTYRTIILTAPNEEKLSVPNCGNRVITKGKLKITLNQTDTKLISNNKYEIFLSKDKLRYLSDMIYQVEPGKELCFDMEEQFINLWW